MNSVVESLGKFWNTLSKKKITVADLGEGPPPLIWVKKNKITEGREAGGASKTTATPTHPPPPAPTHLALGLDLPLNDMQDKSQVIVIKIITHVCNFTLIFTQICCVIFFCSFLKTKSTHFSYL